MSGWVLGVDVGTSTRKAVVARVQEGRVSIPLVLQPGNSQAEVPPVAWYNAVCALVRQAVNEMGTQPDAIGLTAQVGTYILQQRGLPEEEWPVFSWQQNGAEDGMDAVSRFDDAYYIQHIGMRHPKLVSYPLPRLTCFKKNTLLWANTQRIFAPKDYIYWKLTDSFCSDPFTWRGLANPKTGAFSPSLLRDFAIQPALLPTLSGVCSAPAVLSRQAAQLCGLQTQPPVYLGCNDFFAGLLGMGITQAGAAFDLTGTSEHVGVLTEWDVPQLVCGQYLVGGIAYGGTASSGASAQWGNQNWRVDSATLLQYAERLADKQCKPPLFLPYLRGERAPLWNPDARGVFFGLTSEHDAVDMRYAISEGIAFSIADIWHCLPTQMRATEEITVGGGGAGNRLENSLKASLLQVRIKPATQQEPGAVGAALCACTGQGMFTNLVQAAAALVPLTEVGVHAQPTLPHKKLGEALYKRFAVYKSLYPALESQFKVWNTL